MKRISDFKAHESNPFHLSGLGKRVISRRPKTAVMSSDGGDEVVFVEPGDQKVIIHDEQQYVKMFTAGMPILTSLSLRAMTMLLMIMHDIAPRTNEVKITRARSAEFSARISGSAYYIAIAELLQYGIIARSKSKKVFFVNPNIVFNGDRRTMVKDESE